MTVPNLYRDLTGETFLLQSGLIKDGFRLNADNWRGPATEKALGIFRRGGNFPSPQADPTGETFLLQQGLNLCGFSLVADNKCGPKTLAALSEFRESIQPSIPEGQVAPSSWHRVYASSFADPADVRAFDACKSAGGSDRYCFSKGDNGIGYWGAKTSVDVPMVALPRDVWQAAGKRGGSIVWIRGVSGGTWIRGVSGDGTVITFPAELQDTMPSTPNLANKASIDLNPGVQKMLRWKPPFIRMLDWRWG